MWRALIVLMLAGCSSIDPGVRQRKEVQTPPEATVNCLMGNLDQSGTPLGRYKSSVQKVPEGFEIVSIVTFAGTKLDSSYISITPTARGSLIQMRASSKAMTRHARRAIDAC